MKKQKLNGLDFYIIYCIAACIAYAVAELVLSSVTGLTHDALTVAWYGFHGGEIFCAAMIKRMKLHKEARPDNGMD